MQVALTALVASALLQLASARINATSAIDVFMITSCDVCTKDPDSIYCSESTSGSNFVSNGTWTITTREKIRLLGASDGSKFCWEGTFGAILKPNGATSPSDVVLGSLNVTAKLGCLDTNMFYRQCVIPMQLSIILMSIAGIICVCTTTCVCFYCSCCKCCNNQGDTSRFGMCNRFCPSAPCADPPDKEIAIASHLINPLSEEENKSSLFGRNPALSVRKPKSLSDGITKPKSEGNLLEASTPKVEGTTPAPPPPAPQAPAPPPPAPPAVVVREPEVVVAVVADQDDAEREARKQALKESRASDEV